MQIQEIIENHIESKEKESNLKIEFHFEMNQKSLHYFY